MSENKSVTVSIESWFVPIDILRIISNVAAVICALVCLLIILIDKACHTLPMVLTASSCLAILVLSCDLLAISVYTLQSDLEQIQFPDLLCYFRGYLFYFGNSLVNFSFLQQALYRYMSTVYPTRFFWHSTKFQASLICIVWMFCIVFPFPLLITNRLKYNEHGRMCQVPVSLSFPMVYLTLLCYYIPVLSEISLYLRLFRYVRRMQQNITPINVLQRAQKHLKMVRKVVTLSMILFINDCPYAIFVFMSFFGSPPIYYLRIAFATISVAEALVMFVLLLFTDPIRNYLVKTIKRQQNTVVPTAIQINQT